MKFCDEWGFGMCLKLSVGDQMNNQNKDIVM